MSICYIRKFEINKENKKIVKGYFKEHIAENLNHWVQTKEEAKVFNDGRKIKSFIKDYKLKNCEVEYKNEGWLDRKL